MPARKERYKAHGPANTMTIRVRYAEIDAMGFAYHAHFLAWFEAARVELLRSCGYSYAALEQEGYRLPVHQAVVTWHAPAEYDDELRITATLTYMSHLQLDFHYDVHRAEDEKLLAEGDTLMFCIDRSGRPAKIPQHIQDLAVR
jgi:acyl-CoA thioester hydrolase